MDQMLNLDYERTILSAYLPKQMSEQEIRDVIATLPETSTMKDVMGYFKENHGGLYDAKIVANIMSGK